MVRPLVRLPDSTSSFTNYDDTKTHMLRKIR